jgi:Tol biopolymer transport system component
MVRACVLVAAVSLAVSTQSLGQAWQYGENESPRLYAVGIAGSVVPAIDGDLSDWDSYPEWNVLTFADDFIDNSSQTVKDLNSLDITAKVAWHAGANMVYFAFEVLDDRHSRQSATGECLVWKQDALRWYIDADNSGGDYNGGEPEGVPRCGSAQQVTMLIGGVGDDICTCSASWWSVEAPYTYWAGSSEVTASGTRTTYEVGTMLFDSLEPTPDTSTIHQLIEGDVIGMSWTIQDQDVDGGSQTTAWTTTALTRLYGDAGSLNDVELTAPEWGGRSDPPPAEMGVYSRGDTIRVSDADGSNWRRLTTGRWPSLSHDKRTVAYFRGDSLFAIGVDGRDEKALVPREDYVRLAAQFGIAYDLSRPLWSPSDDYLLFQGGWLAVENIFLVMADGSGLRLVTRGGYFARSWPSPYSRDGRYVLLSNEYDVTKGLSALDLATGANVAMTSRASSGAWSPDGQHIAFVNEYYREYENATPGLYVVNADGTGLVDILPQITRPDSVLLAPVGELSWSHDGQELTFESRGRAARIGVKLYAVRLDGSSLRRVDAPFAPWDHPDDVPTYIPPAILPPVHNYVEHTPPAPSPILGPDSPCQIAFFSERTLPDGHTALYLTDTRGSEVRRLSYGWNDVRGYSWSPDGRGIAYAGKSWTDPDWHIFAVGAYGAITQLTERETWVKGPSWSPDGTQIAYLENGSGQNVWITDAQIPSGTDQLTGHGSVYSIRGWSPDGAHIAYTVARAREYDLYLMGADGSGQRMLVEGVYFDTGRWSPDGTAIAYVQVADDSCRVRAVAPDGTDLGQLAAVAPGVVYDLDWSPDGRRIAFTWYRGELGQDVCAVLASGGDLTVLTSGSAGVRDNEPRWSPDGRKILFVSNRDGNQEIYLMNADGSGQTRTTHDPANDFNPSWMPGVSLPDDRATAIAAHAGRPPQLGLHGNYPNPFNASTVIPYDLADDAEVALTVFNLSGQVVRTLVDALLPAGAHRAQWNGTDAAGRHVAAGVYLCKLRVGEHREVRKMALIR